MLELRQMAMFLKDDEETFTELLADKTNKDLLAQKKHRENELQKSVARQKRWKISTNGCMRIISPAR